MDPIHYCHRHDGDSCHGHFGQVAIVMDVMYDREERWWGQCEFINNVTYITAGELFNIIYILYKWPDSFLTFLPTQP